MHLDLFGHDSMALLSRFKVPTYEILRGYYASVILVAPVWVFGPLGLLTTCHLKGSTVNVHWLGFYNGMPKDYVEYTLFKCQERRLVQQQILFGQFVRFKHH